MNRAGSGKAHMDAVLRRRGGEEERGEKERRRGPRNLNWGAAYSVRREPIVAKALAVEKAIENRKHEGEGRTC